MEKPFDLKVKDAKAEISKTINEAKLPISVISYIMQDLCNEIVALENKLLENLKTEYEKANNIEVEKELDIK